MITPEEARKHVNNILATLRKLNQYECDRLLLFIDQQEKKNKLLWLNENLNLAYYALDLHKRGEITLTNLEHACWCMTKDDLIKQIKELKEELK